MDLSNDNDDDDHYDDDGDDNDDDAQDDDNDHDGDDHDDAQDEDTRGSFASHGTSTPERGGKPRSSSFSSSASELL